MLSIPYKIHFENSTYIIYISFRHENNVYSTFLVSYCSYFRKNYVKNVFIFLFLYIQWNNNPNYFDNLYNYIFQMNI